jgi:hypothetical protein
MSIENAAEKVTPKTAENTAQKKESKGLDMMTQMMLYGCDLSDVILFSKMNKIKIGIGDNLTPFICTDIIKAMENAAPETQKTFKNAVLMASTMGGKKDGKNNMSSMMPFLMGGGDIDPMMLMMMNGNDIDPMMLMLMNNKDGKSSKIDPMMLMMMSNNKKDGKKEKNGFDPMMLMLMNKDGGEIDPMMLMMMSGGKIDPMMMMLMNKDKDGKSAIDPMTLMMMSGGDIDPMMLMMMNKDKDGKPAFDPMMLMMMSNNKKDGKKENGGFDPMMFYLMSNKGDENDPQKDKLMKMMMLQKMGGEGNSALMSMLLSGAFNSNGSTNGLFG